MQGVLLVFPCGCPCWMPHSLPSGCLAGRGRAVDSAVTRTPSSHCCCPRHLHVPAVCSRAARSALHGTPRHTSTHTGHLWQRSAQLLGSPHGSTRDFWALQARVRRWASGRLRAPVLAYERVHALSACATAPGACSGARPRPSAVCALHMFDDAASPLHCHVLLLMASPQVLGALLSDIGMSLSH